MYSANQNNSEQRELNPEKFLEGVGPLRWLRLFFQTRAETIRQCDATIDVFVRKMDAQEGELRVLRKLSALMPAQHNALVAIEEFAGLESALSGSRRQAFNNIMREIRICIINAQAPL